MLDSIFSSDSNDQKQDNFRCCKCKKPIPAIFRVNDKGRKIRDRSNRVDCLSSNDVPTSYHKECWEKEVFND